jgi:hypothetical protein
VPIEIQNSYELTLMFSRLIIDNSFHKKETIVCVLEVFEEGELTSFWYVTVILIPEMKVEQSMVNINCSRNQNKKKR